MNPYCISLNKLTRLPTRRVSIGDIILGGDQPIRIQSMTTTDTMNTSATVAEAIRMIEAGCELVRITAPSLKEAENLREIKHQLQLAGFKTPIIADIHFTPNAAELAARIVEKVRINPGNYADKKKFETKEYSDSEYYAEIDRIRKKILPLIRICKEYGTAMRIGTNHGSLSDRILNRYGDTPAGMVESAMEFVRICEDESFHNIVLSMKASNTQVMVEAYRLLAQTMLNRNLLYPIHLGVTEAGEGEDGRLKSAIGIGALLADGIGDTVRVSLTEPPEYEIPVAKYIIQHYQIPAPTSVEINKVEHNPFSFRRLKNNNIQNIGNIHPPRVFIDAAHKSIDTIALGQVGYYYLPKNDKWMQTDLACDYIYVGKNIPDIEIPASVRLICDSSLWQQSEKGSIYPWFRFLESYTITGKRHPECNFVSVRPENVAFLEPSESFNTVVWVIQTQDSQITTWVRNLITALRQRGFQQPVVLQSQISTQAYTSQTEEAQLQLTAACITGGLLVDGLIDGLWLTGNTPNWSLFFANRLTFGLLQASRNRMSKTEYISCPSCGRTLFNLPETTARIRRVTEHLKGLKIGIMGCIVNGPGEMADADFGYVGTGPGLISLYKGHEIIEKNIPEDQAVEKLIALIKRYGAWIDPPE
ncbi:MAG: (E)-4-hydroxy-3-methylbut-2-enyl-diphosphate synthase [Bacteroidia bacterium]|nr:(E)-4-hydroxy-3-methylbut-2-enyl-diphosphate synthase [Bacteroidia bacterium]